jgi:hypothetical protein
VLIRRFVDASFSLLIRMIGFHSFVKNTMLSVLPAPLVVSRKVFFASANRWPDIQNH